MSPTDDYAWPSRIQGERTSNNMTGSAAGSSCGRAMDVEDGCSQEHDLSFEDIYDPDQSVEERRRVQQGFRDLLREVSENSESYLQGYSNGLHQTILRANALSKQVRQTAEAAIDSRLLVSTTDLSYRKALRLAQGTLSQGIDLDEFVSHCITYMRRFSRFEDDGSPQISSAQRERIPISPRRELEDEPDEGDMMDWSYFGRLASLPCLRRPALPGLLLSPLSAQRKMRRATKKNAPLRVNQLTKTRPEILNAEGFAKKENDLTTTCGKILQRLETLQEHLQFTVANLMDDCLEEGQRTQIMLDHGLRSTGGIDFMRFVVNPRSFGQTVENLFYVSFLIRDGRVEIDFDESGLPSLGKSPSPHHLSYSQRIRFDIDDIRAPVKLHSGSGAGRQGASKHQAILSMDMATWQDIIDTFELVDPMIEHRQERSKFEPGGQGWYS